MKKVICLLILVICILNVSCNAPSDGATPQTTTRPEEKILALDSKKDKDEIITQTVNDLGSFFLYTTGRGYMRLPGHGSKNSVTMGEGVIPPLKCVDAFVPIECLRKISEDRLYIIFKSKENNLVYVFYSLTEDDTNQWSSECVLYFANKALSREDFADIKAGDTLADVIKIDDSQKEYFETARNISDDFTSYHITKDGLLIITYENLEPLYEKHSPQWYREPEKLMIVKSMEWSDPLPILEQDLPK